MPDFFLPPLPYCFLSCLPPPAVGCEGSSLPDPTTHLSLRAGGLFQVPQIAAGPFPVPQHGAGMG